VKRRRDGFGWARGQVRYDPETGWTFEVLHRGRDGWTFDSWLVRVVGCGFADSCARCSRRAQLVMFWPGYATDLLEDAP
jgi:hypothetical protein